MQRFDKSNDEVTFSGSSKTGSRVCLIVLAVVVFILLVVAIVFISLYAVEKSKETVPPCEKPPPSEQKFCGSKACFDTTSDMLKQLNQSADPCTDFYEYACGGWEDENELKSGQTFVTGFSLLREKSYDILKDALANASTKYKDNEAVMKAVNFFDACNNVTAVELAGDGPLKKLIDNMGGWNVTGNMTSLSTMDIVSRMAKVARELFVKPFIDVKVFIDPHDSKKHIVQFAQGALGMSPFRYTRNTTEGAIVREAYKTYMKKVAKLLGGGPDSDAQMMQVYELEKQLAELDKTAEASVMIETLKQALPPGAAAFDLRTSLEDFSTVTKIKVEKVIDFVEAYFLKQKRTFNKDEKILAYPLQYFLNLFDFFENQTSTNPVVVVNYIIWSVVDSFIKTLPAKYREANDEFTMSITGNKTTFRWNECITHMQPFFGMPLGLLFVDAAFDEGSKETVEQMTRLMKDEFIKSLDSLPWMSTMTKKNAKNKANGIEQDIGYPSYIKDPKELAAKIKGLTVGDQLFQNALNGASFVAEQSYGSLDKEVDKDKWFMSPSQVNGYYSPRQNRIVFLAAILQPPFYNPSYPSYINYGGIGMVIGHEITHGFDGTGRLFDKDGNINNWWSFASGVGFKERELCLSRQYSQFEVYGQKVDGNKTLNENIADNGGIRLAFNAYKTLVDKQGTEGALPGLGLTEEQLFFVGFARPWCSIYKKKAALQQLATDSHTFPQYRIIGTLHNYDKFAEAFKCKPGAAMNPKQKCTLW